MLLLVAMPTIGRQFESGFALPGESNHEVSKSTGGHGADIRAQDHHQHMAGTKSADHESHLRHMAEMEAELGKAPTPHDEHERHDCAYCPLLSGLAQASGVPRLLLGPAPLAPWSVRIAAAPPLAPPVPALGSQGPPIFL